MEKQFRCTQFREYLFASLFAIIAQFRAMKWRKQKYSFRAIPRIGISIGNPNKAVRNFIILFTK